MAGGSGKKGKKETKDEKNTQQSSQQNDQYSKPTLTSCKSVDWLNFRTVKSKNNRDLLVNLFTDNHVMSDQAGTDL